MSTEVFIRGSGRASSEAIASGQTGPAISIDNHPATVTLTPAGGASGSVQFTTSLPSQVSAGTATWQTWARGTVSAAASDIPEGPITAVRGVSESGVVTLEVVQ